jgi:hypothetical protein
MSLIQTTAFAKNSLKYEVRTAPIALIARWATLDFTIKINDRWVIGPSTIIYAAPKIGNMLSPAYSGFAVGGHAYGYLKSFSENGWYWGNHLYYENYESYPHAFEGHYELSGLKFNTKLGYQFLLKSKFTFLFGAGAEVRQYDQNNISEHTGGAPSFKTQSGTYPFVEAKIGYKF